MMHRLLLLGAASYAAADTVLASAGGNDFGYIAGKGYTVVDLMAGGSRITTASGATTSLEGRAGTRLLNKLATVFQNDNGNLELGIVTPDDSGDPAWSALSSTNAAGPAVIGAATGSTAEPCIYYPTTGANCEDATQALTAACGNVWCAVGPASGTLELGHFTIPTQAAYDALGNGEDPFAQDGFDGTDDASTVDPPVVVYESATGGANMDANGATAQDNSPKGLTGLGGQYIVYSADPIGANNRQIYSFDTSLGTAAASELQTNNGATANPQHLTKVSDDLAVFACDYEDGTADEGVELCQTDGATAGLVFATDSYVGGGGRGMNVAGAAGDDGVLATVPFYLWESSPSGDVVYFAGDGNDGTDWGVELWRTTGTEAGTYRVTDVNTNAGGDGLVGDMISCPGSQYLFFVGNDGTGGNELYYTDGTAGHSQLVLDVTDPASASAAENTGAADATASGMGAVGTNSIACYQGYILWQGDNNADTDTTVDELRVYIAALSDPSGTARRLNTVGAPLVAAVSAVGTPMYEAPWHPAVAPVEPSLCWNGAAGGLAATGCSGTVPTEAHYSGLIVNNGAASDALSHATTHPIKSWSEHCCYLGATGAGLGSPLDDLTVADRLWVEWDITDTDGDGIPDGRDNCPTIANADQGDLDLDGRGNSCDACPMFDDFLDHDGDGTPDGCDTCPCREADNVITSAHDVTSAVDFNTVGWAASTPCDGAALCGDGTIDIGEQCDDGAAVANDGCSATCQLEQCTDSRILFHCKAAPACGVYEANAGSGCTSFQQIANTCSRDSILADTGSVFGAGEAFDETREGFTCEILHLPYDQWVPRSAGTSPYALGDRAGILGHAAIASKSSALVSKTHKLIFAGTILTLAADAAGGLALGTMKGDPHFTSFSGGKYEVRGSPDHMYNIISDTHMQYNARFIGGAHGTTWIDQVGFLFNGHRFQWDASTNQFAFDGQDITMQANFFLKKQLDDSGKHYVSMSQGKHPAPPRLYINLPGFTITITRKQVPKIRFTMASHRDGKMQGEDGKWHFGARPHYFDHSAVQTHEKNATHFVHGLLGQTARLTAPVTEYRHYQRHLHKNGEGVIEGTVDDYEVSDIFGTQFKFNQFKN